MEVPKTVDATKQFVLFVHIRLSQVELKNSSFNMPCRKKSSKTKTVNAMTSTSVNPKELLIAEMWPLGHVID